MGSKFELGEKLWCAIKPKLCDKKCEYCKELYCKDIYDKTSKKNKSKKKLK